MEVPNPPHFFQNRIGDKNKFETIFGALAAGGCLWFLLIILANLAVLALVIVALTGLFVGNFWFNEESLMRKADAMSIPAAKVIDYERGFFGYGEVTFENAEGDRLVYDVGTNILWDTELIEKE